jgi:PAS domain S-box-containing protein
MVGMQDFFRHHYPNTCIVLLGVLVLLGVGGAAAENGRFVRDVVRVGVLGNWPPQYQLDGNGRPAGFAIDVLERIADVANLEIDYKVMDSWEQLSDALRRHRIDLIPNLGISRERKQWAAFTSPVETFPVVIFIRRSTLDIQGAGDLTHRVVGTVQFNVGTRLMKQRDDIELRVFRSIEEAFFELLAGQVDALVYPKPVMMKLTLAAGLEEHITSAGEPLLEVKRAIAVRKDDHELLRRLEPAVLAFVHSTAYLSLYANWFGHSRPFWTPKRIVMLMTTLIVISTIAGVIWHNLRTTAINRRLRQSIHECNRTEEALRASEEKYRLIVEYQNDLILKLAPDGRILFVSPSVFELLGCSADTIIGTNLLSLVHPQDVDTVHLAMQGLPVAPYFCRYEVRCLTSRKWKWFFWSNKAILDPSGRLSEIIAVGRDTTQRKQAELRLKESEEKFRAIFEHAADSVVLLDALTLKIVDFNATAHQNLGYTRDYFKQQSLTSLLVVEPPDTIASTLKILLRADRRPVEAMLKTKSGRIRYYRIKQQPVTISDHHYSLGIWHDITDRKQFEDYLVHSQKTEAIGTLAGGVAHDFNNILSIIIGNTELAGEAISTDHPLHQNLTEIKTAGLRARDIVAQLLSLSRHEETRRSPIRPAQVIEESLQLLRVSIPATIEIRKKLSPQPMTVLSDATQIQQVLINLCNNAAHAMAAGGGVLTVSLDMVDLDRAAAVEHHLNAGAYACMTVEDTGTGIEPANMDRIFDPYFTTKPAHLGTGMGLAMVHGIVTKYGGSVTVDSRLGRGSRFSVFLPLSEAVAAVESRSREESLSGRGRLLLIDDEPSILRLGTQYLSQLGYDVMTADCSERALALFRSAPHRFDLIVTDMSMPKISGDVLIKEIFDIDPRMPVIVCSGHSNAFVREKMQPLGVDGFVEKPYHMRTLARAIKQTLEKRTEAAGERRADSVRKADEETPPAK